MSDHKKNILIVDDDSATVEALKKALSSEGYGADGVVSSKEAFSKLQSKNYDLVLSDLVMPELDGIGLLEKVKEKDPDLPLIVCTGFGSIPSAVEAIRKGAADYMTKPVNLDQLFLVVERALRTSNLAKENKSLKKRLKRFEGFEKIVGRSTAMREVFQKIETAAPTDATVLIRGESGSGKELVARAIHNKSLRVKGPLVKANCAAFTDTLIESELFGYEKGAFTGAYRQTKGRVEIANNGTLFLDEIGDLSPNAQSKMLRLLQQRTFERVGGTASQHVDIRLIGATHRNLEKQIEDGQFREDLYYRINVIRIDIPPLRQRVEDISLLFNTFFDQNQEKYNKEFKSVQRDVFSALESYHWPGNVRELMNLVENLVIMVQKDSITVADLPDNIIGNTSDDCREALLDGSHSLDEIQREVIHRTLARTKGNKSEVAKILGIGLKTLYRRLNEMEEDE